MDELVARIVAAGLTSAVFTYFIVQLVVKPALVRRGDAWWRSLATNGASLVIAILVAFGLMFILADDFTRRTAVETLLVGVIAASAATYGNEVVKNYGKRGDVITVGNIEDSDNVAIGQDAEVE